MFELCDVPLLAPPKAQGHLEQAGGSAEGGPPRPHAVALGPLIWRQQMHASW